MNRKITDFTLDVYKEASNLYLTVIMAMLFCAGIPAMLPLAMLNIVSRYIVNRSLLQTYSTKIDGLGE
jgi:TRAP-type C4-dicarboxylate transport system permease small subunit